MGLGGCTVNNARHLARPSAQGLEVMLHQQETCQQSSPECGESGTEAFSMRYPGPQASGQAGEMGPRTVWGLCPTESQSPRHGCPQARSRPQSSRSESETRSAISDSLRHGILQARTLDWVAFPFSRGSSQHKAVNLSPVPASMTYKLQRTIWAWSPEAWAAGGCDPGY